MKLLNSSAVAKLLQAANITNFSDTPPSSLWAQGANNSIFRLQLNANQCLAIKQYRKDSRNRLLREFQFSTYAWNQGIHCIPEPLSSLQEEDLALYSFVQGDAFTKHSLQLEHVQEALNFAIQLNQNKIHFNQLMFAEEACLTLSHYFTSVENRLHQLLKAPIKNTLDKEARDFIQKILLPKWAVINREALVKIKNNHLDLKEHLSKEEMCVSPSDFGFHNALLADQRTIFIDFEYAGLDDPAKLVCDFFLQPAIPISPTVFLDFATKIAELTPNSQKCLNRINIVFPICKIKWACIMLNVFRGLKEYSLEKKAEQLNKAKLYINEFKNWEFGKAGAADLRQRSDAEAAQLE